jgi:1-acyl-sn-glycerol-3-phosphate acyltransferase
MRPPVLVRGDSAFYRFARGTFALTLSPLLRLTSEGTGHLPQHGAAIVAVNHKSDLDPVLAGISFRRHLAFFAKSELFENRVLGGAVSRLGAMPVRRGESDRRALENALACLERGEALMIFPEGTRFADDEIHPFQPGIGMLAMRSGAPVIPAAIRGSQTALHGSPRFPRVSVLAGPPVDLSDLEGRRSAVYTAASRRVEAEVRALYERLKGS